MILRLSPPSGLPSVSLIANARECWYARPNSSPPRHRWYLKERAFENERGPLDVRGRRMRPGYHSTSTWIVFGCNCTQCHAEVAVRVDSLLTDIDGLFGAIVRSGK